MPSGAESCRFESSFKSSRSLYDMNTGRVAFMLTGCLSLVLLFGSAPHFSASAHRAGRRAARPFRVMTYNIRYDDPRAGEIAWANRREMVASMIRFHGADIVGLQEALANQLADLERMLPGFVAFGAGRDDGGRKGEFSAILYNKARFKFLSGATFWLSETPNVPGSKGWDAAYPRVVTWAKFEERATRKTFFHFNTHFDHRGERARVESARLLLQSIRRIAGRSSPFIVTGDFNFNEAAEEYRILTGKADGKSSGARVLHDARYLSPHGHHGPTATFNDFKALVPDSKIDHVFIGGAVKVRQHGVLSDTWDGRFPSDHLPVLAEVVLD
jgi:endonuclease/exonuclease/phosphatase family metal-dependent hydrolase